MKLSLTKALLEISPHKKRARAKFEYKKFAKKAQELNKYLDSIFETCEKLGIEYPNLEIILKHIKEVPLVDNGIMRNLLSSNSFHPEPFWNVLFQKLIFEKEPNFLNKLTKFKNMPNNPSDEEWKYFDNLWFHLRKTVEEARSIIIGRLTNIRIELTWTRDILSDFEYYGFDPKETITDYLDYADLETYKKVHSDISAVLQAAQLFDNKFKFLIEDLSEIIEEEF